MSGAAVRRRQRHPAIVLLERFLPVLVISFALVAWELLAILNVAQKFVNPVFFPGSLKVAASAWEMALTGELAQHLGASLSRVVFGFSIAAVIGVPLGTVAGRNRWISGLLDPIISVLRPIPPIALLPIMVVWLGIGDTSKIIFIAYAAFFQIFLTTYNGVQSVEPLFLRAAQTLGASRWRIFRKVVLPAAMPHIVTGIRLGFSVSFFVIVAAEFIGASAGLGFLIFESRVYFEVDKMMVAAVTIGALGFAFDFTMKRIERRLFRWRL
ncbi:MAG: ABC transporter permease [Alphaproteobacteria bacterium]|nr:ABC transporter permease [Alphaproteobacteria bacterium]